MFTPKRLCATLTAALAAGSLCMAPLAQAQSTDGLQGETDPAEAASDSTLDALYKKGIDEIQRKGERSFYGLGLKGTF